MNPLQPNPQNGFLESRSSRAAFDAYKKSLFLQIAHEAVDAKEYPDMDLICKQVGIDIRTLFRHLAADSVFQSEWQAVKMRLSAVYTKKLAAKADTKMGTLANLAILRNLETGRWSEDRSIPSGHLSGQKEVIDAVIIESDPEIAGNHTNSNGTASTPA